AGRAHRAARVRDGGEPRRRSGREAARAAPRGVREARPEPARAGGPPGERVDQGGLTLTGRRKAAILCVSLGPAGAAEIFKRLSPDVLEQLTVELARTPYVDPDQAAKVWEEVVETAYARGFIAEGGMDYAREVLSRALGPGRADE